MGQILRHWRTPAAVVFSVVIIIGAYVLARGIESPSKAEASAELALLQAIATKDSDGDGLSDWEEALYGADPRVVDTFGLGMSDSEAVAKGLVVPKAIADIQVSPSSPATTDSHGLPPPAPEGTLTAAFTEHFFATYLATKEAKGGADLSEEDIANIATEALTSFSSAIATTPDYKSAQDLTVSGSGPDALKAFAANAEAVFMKNKTIASKSELLYLQDAIEKDDATAFSYITSIAKGYRDSATGLAVLPVPQALVADHLALINSMMRISEITSDFARVNDDPIATMLALQQYPQTVLSFGNALLHINQIYTAAGISLPAGSPGAAFVNLIESVTPKP